jgi:hypothetical protein
MTDTQKIKPFGPPEKPLRTGDQIEAYGKTWTVIEPPQLPPIRAENMLKQAKREEWQVQAHPVRWLRGNDHG